MKLTPVQKEIVELLKVKGNTISYVGVPVKFSGHVISNKEGTIIKRMQYRTFRNLVDKKIIIGQNHNQYFILNPNFK